MGYIKKLRDTAAKDVERGIELGEEGIKRVELGKKDIKKVE